MKTLKLAALTICLGLFAASCSDNQNETDTTMTDSTTMQGGTDMTTGAGGTGTDMGNGTTAPETARDFEAAPGVLR